MGSTATGNTPLKRHKSVKFHLDDSKKIKPSIKITVSSDALAETILANSISSSTEDDDGAFTNSPSPQKPALIQIVGNCCTNPSTGGVSNPPPNGVLCSCANGDENRTRIALDDFTVLEFPNCIDFGIKDFLCCKDEIELDLSSDTDASFLDATPPHRFSDSELETQIEAMSITLDMDTTLNPFPNRNPFVLESTRNSGHGEEDDDDEEETTEESFIMDEEEASSSASNNSGLTICGGGTMDGDMADLEQDEQFQHPSFASSTDPIIPGEVTLLPPLSSSQPEPKNLIKPDHDGDEEDDHAPHESISIAIAADEDGEAQPITEDKKLDAQRDNVECTNANIGEVATPQTSEFAGVDDRSRPINEEQIASEESESVQRPISRKILIHPKKHFKRQISLPASIFMSYLLEQNNKANYCSQQSPELKSNLNHNNRDKLAKHNKLNRSNSCSKKSATKFGNGLMLEMRLPLSKSDTIQEYRSAKKVMQRGSTEDLDCDDVNNSNSVSDHEHEHNEDLGDMDTTSSTADEDEDPLGRNCKWSWESKSDRCRSPMMTLMSWMMSSRRSPLRLRRDP